MLNHLLAESSSDDSTMEQGGTLNVISEIDTIEGSALARLHFYRVDASYKKLTQKRFLLHG